MKNKKQELKKKLAKAQKPQFFDEPAEANFSVASAMDETVVKQVAMPTASQVKRPAKKVAKNKKGPI